MIPEHEARYGPDSGRHGAFAQGPAAYGAHSVNVDTAYDPRYESDLGHHGTQTDSTHYGHQYSGPEHESTGRPPHKMELLNKLDPRVKTQGTRRP